MSDELQVLVQESDSGSWWLIFSGDWKQRSQITAEQVVSQLQSTAGPPSSFEIDTSKLKNWDSSFIALLYSLLLKLEKQQVKAELTKCDDGIVRLLTLARAVPAPKNKTKSKHTRLELIGIKTVEIHKQIKEVLSFVGECALGFVRLLSGKSRVRRDDLILILRESGPDALPIVTLISVLVGLILAFIGSIQLRQFGAQIYVADMVGIAMAREMAAIMVGVIMAGRTGAAFAAQLGTMQVNEEIDALRTLGISPVDFLVIPRMIALIVMLPILSLYGLAAGILGGSLVGFMALDVNFWQYIYRTFEAVQLIDVWIGLSKGLIFGVLVALCGCYFGMKCGRNASAVGLAATSAVVSGIVCIVVSDAVFAFVCNIIGI